MAAGELTSHNRAQECSLFMKRPQKLWQPLRGHIPSQPCCPRRSGQGWGVCSPLTVEDSRQLNPEYIVGVSLPLGSQNPQSSPERGPGQPRPTTSKR